MRKIIALTLITVILITLYNGADASNSIIKAGSTPNSVHASSNLLVIDSIHLEVKKGNSYVQLEDLIEESQKVQEQNPNPKIVNGSSIRIYTMYSTIIGRSESLVIHHFSVDIYKDLTGESDVLNRSYDNIVSYRYHEPEDFVLPPNSTKSEVLEIPSLYLAEVGLYKFVFRVQFHIFEGDELPKDVLYHTNLTFELVEAYPTPPYVLIYSFYFVTFIFIMIVALGFYGDRKYKVLE
ncbi:MAG: hypothetical protein ACTSR2_04605 [Candidatus Hodarchaeales archaeon]